MSEENYNVEIKEEKCLCHSKWFKKFLIITFGTFVGVSLALCLFAATHKPPMPGACPCGCGCPMMRRAMMHNHFHHFDKGMRGNFQRKMSRECPVRVEIDD